MSAKKRPADRSSRLKGQHAITKFTSSQPAENLFSVKRDLSRSRMNSSRNSGQSKVIDDDVIVISDSDEEPSSNSEMPSSRREPEPRKDERYVSRKHKKIFNWDQDSPTTSKGILGQIKHRAVWKSPQHKIDSQQQGVPTKPLSPKPGDPPVGSGRNPGKPSMTLISHTPTYKKHLKQCLDTPIVIMGDTPGTSPYPHRSKISVPSKSATQSKSSLPSCGQLIADVKVRKHKKKVHGLGSLDKNRNVVASVNVMKDGKVESWLRSSQEHFKTLPLPPPSDYDKKLRKEKKSKKRPMGGSAYKFDQDDLLSPSSGQGLKIHAVKQTGLTPFSLDSVSSSSGGNIESRTKKTKNIEDKLLHNWYDRIKVSPRRPLGDTQRAGSKTSETVDNMSKFLNQRNSFSGSRDVQKCASEINTLSHFSQGNHDSLKNQNSSENLDATDNVSKSVNERNIFPGSRDVQKQVSELSTLPHFSQGIPDGLKDQNSKIEMVKNLSGVNLRESVGTSGKKLSGRVSPRSISPDLFTGESAQIAAYQTRGFLAGKLKKTVQELAVVRNIDENTNPRRKNSSESSSGSEKYYKLFTKMSRKRDKEESKSNIFDQIGSLQRKNSSESTGSSGKTSHVSNKSKPCLRWEEAEDMLIDSIMKSSESSMTQKTAFSSNLENSEQKNVKIITARNFDSEKMSDTGNSQSLKTQSPILSSKSSTKSRQFHKPSKPVDVKKSGSKSSIKAELKMNTSSSHFRTRHSAGLKMSDMKSDRSVSSQLDSSLKSWVSSSSVTSQESPSVTSHRMVISETKILASSQESPRSSSQLHTSSVTSQSPVLVSKIGQRKRLRELSFEEKLEAKRQRTFGEVENSDKKIKSILDSVLSSAKKKSRERRLGGLGDGSPLSRRTLLFSPPSASSSPGSPRHSSTRTQHIISTSIKLETKTSDSEDIVPKFKTDTVQPSDASQNVSLSPKAESSSVLPSPIKFSKSSEPSRIGNIESKSGNLELTKPIRSPDIFTRVSKDVALEFEEKVTRVVQTSKSAADNSRSAEKITETTPKMDYSSPTDSSKKFELSETDKASAKSFGNDGSNSASTSGIVQTAREPLDVTKSCNDDVIEVESATSMEVDVTEKLDEGDIALKPRKTSPCNLRSDSVAPPSGDPKPCSSRIGDVTSINDAVAPDDATLSKNANNPLSISEILRLGLEHPHGGVSSGDDSPAIVPDDLEIFPKVTTENMKTNSVNRDSDMVDITSPDTKHKSDASWQGIETTRQDVGVTLSTSNTDTQLASNSNSNALKGPSKFLSQPVSHKTDSKAAGTAYNQDDASRSNADAELIHTETNSTTQNSKPTKNTVQSSKSTSLFDIDEFFFDDDDNDDDVTHDNPQAASTEIEFNDDLPEILRPEKISAFRKQDNLEPFDMDESIDNDLVDELPELVLTPRSKRRESESQSPSRRTSLQDSEEMMTKLLNRTLGGASDRSHDSLMDSDWMRELDDFVNAEPHLPRNPPKRLRSTGIPNAFRSPQTSYKDILADTDFSKIYKKHSSSLKRLVRDKKRDDELDRIEQDLLSDLKQGGFRRTLEQAEQGSGEHGATDSDEDTKKAIDLMNKDWGSLPQLSSSSQIFSPPVLKFCEHNLSLGARFDEIDFWNLNKDIRNEVQSFKTADDSSLRSPIIGSLLSWSETSRQTYHWLLDVVQCHLFNDSIIRTIESNLKHHKSSQSPFSISHLKSCLRNSGINGQMFTETKESTPDYGVCSRCLLQRRRIKPSNVIGIIKVIHMNDRLFPNFLCEDDRIEFIVFLLLLLVDGSFIARGFVVTDVLIMMLKALKDWDDAKFTIARQLLDTCVKLNVLQAIALRIRSADDRGHDLSRILSFTLLQIHVLGLDLDIDIMEGYDDIEELVEIVNRFSPGNLELVLVADDEEMGSQKRAYYHMSLLLPLLNICIGDQCEDDTTVVALDRIWSTIRTMNKRIRDNGAIYRSQVKYELALFAKNLRLLTQRAPKADKASIFKYLRSAPVHEEFVTGSQEAPSESSDENEESYNDGEEEVKGQTDRKPPALDDEFKLAEVIKSRIIGSSAKD